MHAFWITSTYDSETDSLILRARSWDGNGPYPQEANWIIYNRVENDAYGVVWGYDDLEALKAAFRIMTLDMPKQMSDPVGEASYYERLT